MISQATLGYILKRIPETENIANQVSQRKSSIWSWISKKFGSSNVIEPKDAEVIEKSEIVPCRLNDFPIPVLRMENSLDHLITLHT